MTLPLAGIRVVDLSQIVSGPMAACLLAGQGAAVIKVETPGGDPVRVLGPRKGDLSAMFIAVNRGKRGIALDLRLPEAAAVLSDLIRRADVLVENFRPGVLERLGFGYEACQALNPALIFASITGFGPDGPYSNIRVYDSVVQAVSGLAATQTGADGKPSLIKTLIADKASALTAAQAITAALFARERRPDGRGQHVRISMLDAALAFNWPDGMYNHSFLDDPPPPFPEYGALVRLWDAADGQVTASAMQDHEFTALMRAAGLDGLAVDPRFAGASGRVRHRADWLEPLAAAFGAAGLDELMAGFVAHGAVGGRVNTLAEVSGDPQVVHSGAIEEACHGDLGRVRGARPAARFGAAEAVGLERAPHLGEHGRAILAELGRSEAEIAALFASGAALVRAAAK